jgi:ABC-type Mn2+/Zn2+ transport system ATPase subunit
MSEPLITFDNLAIGYDGRAVLSGISLAIARTSFTAILGANGSGKSTLLKTLLGLQPPVAGRIHFASPPVFGYVPQTTELDPLYPLTGFDVALMGTYGRVGPGRFPPHDERQLVRNGGGRLRPTEIQPAFRRTKTACPHRPRAGHPARRAGS